MTQEYILRRYGQRPYRVVGLLLASLTRAQRDCEETISLYATDDCKFALYRAEYDESGIRSDTLWVYDRIESLVETETLKRDIRDLLRLATFKHDQPGYAALTYECIDDDWDIQCTPEVGPTYRWRSQWSAESVLQSTARETYTLSIDKTGAGGYVVRSYVRENDVTSMEWVELTDDPARVVEIIGSYDYGRTSNHEHWTGPRLDLLAEIAAQDEAIAARRFSEPPTYARGYYDGCNDYNEEYVESPEAAAAREERETQERERRAQQIAASEAREQRKTQLRARSHGILSGSSSTGSPLESIALNLELIRIAIEDGELKLTTGDNSW